MFWLIEILTKICSTNYNIENDWAFFDNEFRLATRGGLCKTLNYTLNTATIWSGRFQYRIAFVNIWLTSSVFLSVADGLSQTQTQERHLRGLTWEPYVYSAGGFDMIGCAVCRYRRINVGDGASGSRCGTTFGRGTDMIIQSSSLVVQLSRGESEFVEQPQSACI